jgi:multiple sugar transport system permease protein
LAVSTRSLGSRDRASKAGWPSELVRTRRGRKRALDVVSLVVLLIGGAFVLLPIFWLFETAFKQATEAYVIPPQFLFRPTLENFRTLLQGENGEYLQDVVHSLVLLGSSVAVALALGTPAGYALSRSRFRGSRALSVWLIAVYITPALVYIVPLYVIYEKLGLTGSYLSLILYYETFQLPFVVFMMRGYFSDVPMELDDAARIDGCSRWLAFRRVILPVVLPGVATVTILISIGAWGEYFGALILTDPSTQTAPVALANYVGLETSNWGALAAGALVLIVPVLLVISFVQRGYMRQALTGSGG